MKLSLAPVLVSALALVACDVHHPDPITTPKDTPQEAPITPKRKLVTGTALPTSPVNLLLDPGFSLVGQEQGYGSFLSFYAKNYGSFTPYAAVDSTSPAGFSGAVLYIRPARATDDKSDAILMLASFPGGNGPFDAEMWASKATVKDEPAEMPADGSALTVTVAGGTPETGGFDLKADFADTRTTPGGRTWIRYHGQIQKPLTEGAFFVIRTGTAGGNVLLAAPSVTSSEVTAGGAVMAYRPKDLALRPRALAADEREVIARYRAVPPRLSAPALPTRPAPRGGL